MLAKEARDSVQQRSLTMIARGAARENEQREENEGEVRTRTRRPQVDANEVT